MWAFRAAHAQKAWSADAYSLYSLETVSIQPTQIILHYFTFLSQPSQNILVCHVNLAADDACSAYHRRVPGASSD
jgi:hypothetical protein